MTEKHEIYTVILMQKVSLVQPRAELSITCQVYNLWWYPSYNKFMTIHIVHVSEILLITYALNNLLASNVKPVVGMWQAGKLYRLRLCPAQKRKKIPRNAGLGQSFEILSLGSHLTEMSLKIAIHSTTSITITSNIQRMRWRWCFVCACCVNVRGEGYLESTERCRGGGGGMKVNRQTH